jgi:hypothetical protein
MYFTVLVLTPKCSAKNKDDVSLIAEAKMGFAADDVWCRV